MKILVVSSTYVGWTEKFILQQHTGNGENDHYTLLSLIEVPEEYLQRYQDLGVVVLSAPAEVQGYAKDHNPIHRRKAVRIGQYFFAGLKDYDVINYQFVSAFYLPFFRGIINPEKRLVFSYWGSDLMRQKPWHIWLERSFLKKYGIAFATFDNLDLQQMFLSRYPIPENKTKVVYFADEILGSIDHVRVERQDVRRIAQQEIPDGKVIVSIGYNAGEAQQHLSVIRELGRLDDSVKENIVLLLQMTYNGTAEYREACKAACAENGLETVVLDSFLEKEDVAKIRLVTDVFINAQTTDAFAGSFGEYMYTDTEILNAVWLHYRELDAYQIAFKEFQTFLEIPEKLQECLKKQEDSTAKKQSRNPEIIRQMRSAKACRENWNEVFRQLKM